MTLPQQSRECFISTLPAELILGIFAYLPPPDYSYVMYVCRSWRLIYGPILFRDIDVSRGPASQKSLAQRIQKLCMALDKTPSGYSYVRSVKMYTEHADEGTIDLLAKLITRCSGIHSISLRTNFTIRNMPLILSIKNLPHIETLSLSGAASTGGHGPLLGIVFDHFNMSTLKRLSLSQYRVGRSSTNPRGFWGGASIETNEERLESLLPRSCYQTGDWTSLELSDPRTPYYVTERLLHFPRRLEHLSVRFIWSWRFPGEYTVDRIQQWIDMHCHSLKSLTLGQIPPETFHMPCFSNLRILEKLTVSYYNIFKESPSNALKKLAVPSLRLLTICFSREFRHHFPVPTRGDFNLEQVAWIKEFALLRQEFPASKLERLEIDFNPDGEPRHDSDDSSWPWKYVEEAKQSVAEFGLVLEYKCRWTEEGWYKAIEDLYERRLRMMQKDRKEMLKERKERREMKKKEKEMRMRKTELAPFFAPEDLRQALVHLRLT